MIIAYLLLFALCFVQCKPRVVGLHEDYLSKSVTDSIKGLFICLVFFSHFNSYVTYTAALDLQGVWISKKLGQLIVALFLFYSGFGVAEAIKKKSVAYVKSFPKNRVLKTLVHFDLALVLFILMDLTFGVALNAKKILLSLVCWDSIGNSNWYIFTILFCYIFTWITFLLFKKKPWVATLAVSVLSIGFIVWMKLAKPGETWWYDTVLCYAFGMWFSLAKEGVDSFLRKNKWAFWVVLLVVFVGFFFVYQAKQTTIHRETKAILFCLIFVLGSMKFKVNNKVLSWLGSHLFEIYILQRIPMYVLKRIGLLDFNLYLYFVACLAITIGLAAGFHYLIQKFDAIVFVPKKV